MHYNFILFASVHEPKKLTKSWQYELNFEKICERINQ